MSGLLSIERILDSRQIHYTLFDSALFGPRLQTWMEAVPSAECTAQALLLSQGEKTAVAVTAKSRDLDLDKLNGEFSRHFAPGTGRDLRRSFPDTSYDQLLVRGLSSDCEMFIDQALVECPLIAFQSDRRNMLVCISSDDFCELFKGAWCASISAARRHTPLRECAPAQR